MRVKQTYTAYTEDLACACGDVFIIVAMPSAHCDAEYGSRRLHKSAVLMFNALDISKVQITL